MAKGIHMCQSVEGPLMNWTKRDWTRHAKYMKHGDGTPFYSGDDLKSFFVQKLSEGYKVLPMCDCENFDKAKGCQGYEYEPGVLKA